MNLINCDNLQVISYRGYGGATGSKIAVVYDNNVWMLKRGQIVHHKNFHNVELSYANDPITEYIGSHVYALFGIPVHDTLLGTYNGRMCVLCKDLAYPDQILELRMLRNMIMQDSITQSSSGMSPKLSDILEVVELSSIPDKQMALYRFWIMFTIDALIGNTDRNNGNWGYLRDGDSMRLCPVYDCGGCLNNKRSDAQVEADLSTGNVSNLALNYTFNFLNEKGKRINPFKYIASNCNDYIRFALNLFDKGLATQLDNLIDSLGDVISPIRNKWYKEILHIRLNKLLELKEELCK